MAYKCLGLRRVELTTTTMLTACTHEMTTPWPSCHFEGTEPVTTAVTTCDHFFSTVSTPHHVPARTNAEQTPG